MLLQKRFQFFFDHRVFRDEMLRLLENREFLKANPAKTSSFVRVVEIFDRRRSEDADDMFAGNPDESDHETCHAASHLCRFPSRESPTPSRSGDWLGVHGPSDYLAKASISRPISSHYLGDVVVNGLRSGICLPMQDARVVPRARSRGVCAFWFIYNYFNLR